ncbi:DUF393 domain-containing protein [Methylobacterium sp. E-005]|uniref:thiol-disulfide oxidoreductase DCC family protein n=1 Tax=Methylobacterium sp. E-005 TaxID=2836549 RepID=UPI001FBB8098|nr:DUF393 domain-containing protein [Methylobacterium sp. E-005]MCJ2090017.1 DUF393 domain-containing protein [Methylobacterium sp. E-005]
MSGASGETLRIFYDGDCPLCRAEIGHYRACAGADRLTFVDVGCSRPAPALGPGLTRAAALRRFHVRTAEGRLVSGADAFAHVWRNLPGWRWLGRLLNLRIFGVRPVLAIAEIAYRLSLPLRPRLARWIARRS